MPNAADILIDTEASFLLVGDGGTHKSFFIGTCPQPSYTFDLDKGMAIHAGRADMDYDTFKELPKGQKPHTGKLSEGWYEWGKAWPAFLLKLNELGRSIDDGSCKYKTLGIDSLTLLTDICQSYILRENKRDLMEQRDWQAFLANMSAAFSQLTGWPLVKVLTAHVRRDENLLSGNIEKLPLVPGQFSGKVAVYFDEVYYTEVVMLPGKKPEDPKVPRWIVKTVQDGTIKQAKSRKYNVPTGTEADFNAVLEFIRRKVVKSA